LDNCTNYEKEILEGIQYEAARLVTGLTCSVGINNLLDEISCIPLKDRRNMQKPILMYKYKQGVLPNYVYVTSIMPQTVSSSTPYNLRNRKNLETHMRRTKLNSNSTIPSSVKLWNDLCPDIKYCTTLLSFKNKLKQMYLPTIVPKHFLFGERSVQISHTRLRNKCSNFNQIFSTNS